MKNRRMFSNAIVNSDVFLDLPLSTQALYFHLVMDADDEGFVGNPKRLQRVIGATDKDMQNLIDKRYILTFQSGIIVIKHWYIHNYIPKERFNKTTYTEEKSTLKLDDKNAYTEISKCNTGCHTKCNTECNTDVMQNDNQVSYECTTQIKLNEIKLNKNKRENAYTHAHEDILQFIPTLQEVKDFFILKSISIDPERFYNYYSSLGWKKGNTPIENWQLLALEWNRKDQTETRMKNGFKERKETTFKFGDNQITDDEL